VLGKIKYSSSIGTESTALQKCSILNNPEPAYAGISSINLELHVYHAWNNAQNAQIRYLALNKMQTETHQV